MVQPLVREAEVLGVVELGTLYAFSDKALAFLDLVAEAIAVGIATLLSHERAQSLLAVFQAQTKELSVRQAELWQANETLEKQAVALRTSEANLQAQQEELRQTNEELEEQAQLREEQKRKISRKNEELERTHQEIEKKARDLDMASRYKSEFLANMSHELRTPLNSILLLSQHLSENKDNTLTEKQVECAATVHASGNDLLALINEVLDLAKVEAGKMTLELEETAIGNSVDAMEKKFRPVAQNRGIEFEMHVTECVPKTITTDCQRLSQILKNLLSNGSLNPRR